MLYNVAQFGKLLSLLYDANNLMNVQDPTRQPAFIPPIPIPGITFRLARQQDLRTLQENCYPEIVWWEFQHHYEQLLKWQENGRCYIVVAETAPVNRIGNSIQATIIGSGQLISPSNKGEIAELAVQPHYRNRGIGTALIHILTHIAQERKTTILEIGAAIDNQAALRLYRRLGFGRDRLVSLPDTQEAVILSKYLTRDAK